MNQKVLAAHVSYLVDQEQRQNREEYAEHGPFFEQDPESLRQSSSKKWYPARSEAWDVVVFQHVARQVAMEVEGRQMGMGRPMDKGEVVLERER